MATAQALLVMIWTSLVPATELKLTVRVYNYAELPRKTLSDAEDTARRTFHKVGIDTKWIECPKEQDEENQYPACRKPGTPADVILYIVSRSMEGYDVRTTAFGFALPSGDGQPARAAYVFYSRVQQAVRKSGKVSVQTLLAYVMVHEIAHLLLGPGFHAERGIMVPKWGPADLREMERGGLRFTADDVRALQAGTQERASAHAGIR